MGPPTPAALLDATGTGIQSTKKFLVPRNWEIQFSYDNCPGLDGTGTSIVSVWDARGQIDFAIDIVGTGGTDFAKQYNGPDTVWLEVNSACTWNITVGSLPAALQAPPTSAPVSTSTTTTTTVPLAIVVRNPPRKPPRGHASGRRRTAQVSHSHG